MLQLINSLFFSCSVFDVIILFIIIEPCFSTGPSEACECEMNDAEWRFDEGTITNGSRLPVKNLYFSDTNELGELGYFTLGPLICY